jgi:diguanylate cyclase (GGDEF)-like protein
MSEARSDVTDLNWKKFTILIIDDNSVNLRVAVDYLQESGLTILVAKDGERGIKQAKDPRPDLIVLDVVMPGIDGFETCRRLKMEEETKDIPVIFLTALSDTGDKVKGFQYGAVDFVTKPIQREELLARIGAHLRIQALTQKLQEQNHKLKQQALELKIANEAAEAANRKLARLVNLDSLTQIANRRHFDQHLNREWRRLMRDGAALSLIMCDIDYFKNYNDYYGHQAGDDCLRRVAQAIARIPERPGDLVARYGGEEISAILPYTNAQGAVQIAEVIQLAIKQLQIRHHRSYVSQHVTISMGISCLVPDRDRRLESLIAAADRALYIAKERGRNMYHLHVS